MKAAAFDYMRPDDLAEAMKLLARYGEEARLIAGGQSLVPMMAMRLARPAVLIDIGRLNALQGMDIQNDGILIRAATRQVAIEQAVTLPSHVPLLAAALPHVGHIQTRNRGTIGGSVAHADPTAEILLVAVALGAELTLQSIRGSRSLAVTDFVEGPMQTGVNEDECVTEIRFPRPPVDCRIGVAFDEISPRAGDYAIIGVAAEVGLDAEGFCRHARLAACGASPVPVRAVAVEAALLGSALTDDEIMQATRLLEPALDPHTDIQASAGYRRWVAPQLLAHAIAAARTNALGALR